MRIFFSAGFGKVLLPRILLEMVEKWHKTLYEGAETGTVLTDFSKTALITIC